MKGIQTLILFLAMQALYVHAETLPIDRSLFTVESPVSWVQTDVLDAFFSRIENPKNHKAIAVPAVTVGLRIARLGIPPRGIVYAVLPDKDGKKIRLPLDRPLFETTWALTSLPFEMPVDLLDRHGAVVETLKFVVSAKPDVVVANGRCRELGFGPLDPQLHLSGTLFLVCDDPSLLKRAPLTILYGGGKSRQSFRWSPQAKSDEMPFPQVLRIDGMNPYLALDILEEGEQDGGQPLHIDFMYRHSFESLQWGRRFDWGMGLGLQSSWIAPGGGGAKSIRFFSDMVYHLVPGRWDLQASPFAVVNFARSKPDLVPVAYWGARVTAAIGVGSSGHWSFQMPFGVRFYDFGAFHEGFLRTVFGPALGLGTTYNMPRAGDRVVATSMISPETFPGQYHFNNFNWYNEIRWQHVFPDGRSWGMKAHFDYLATGASDGDPYFLNTLMAAAFFTL